MKKINYYFSRGIEYGKIPASSYREGGKVRKKNDGIYLGKVIDKATRTFFNDERGFFTYDPMTGIYGPADERLTSDRIKDQRKRERILLDFGDSFFLSEVIKQMKYNTVIESIPYRNTDTIYALLAYYVLQDKANCHAQTWYEGNFVRMLYPQANLVSQRITTFLESIGRYDRVLRFFDAHVGWVNQNISSDPAVLIDSTGLPNSIHFPLAGISNHNGKVSREVRMVTMLQRDSGYPFLFRLVPGNVVDMSTLTRAVMELGQHGIPTDYVLIDAGYFSDPNVDQLYESNIDFLSRLPVRNKNIYSKVLQDCLPKLKRKENLVNYDGRYLYIASTEVKIGTNKDHTAYAYLGYDVDRAGDETHKAVLNARQNKITEAELQKALEDAGLFVIIASLPFRDEEILPAYYVRQLVEQYFDVGKSISHLTPLRVHSEEALYGHLMLSMMAATINLYIMKATKQFYADREEMFTALHNQKCIVYNSRVNTNEAVSIANNYYDKLGIKCPLYLDRSGDKLIPRYSIPAMNSGDEV